MPVAQLVISLENMEMKLMDCLMGCADALGTHCQPYGVLRLLRSEPEAGRMGRPGGDVFPVG